MKELLDGLTAFGSGLDETALGALLGVTFTCFVAYAGHVVTHWGARSSLRLAVAEKRAILAVRGLARDAAGTGLEGRLVNLGPTVANRVRLEIDDDAISLGAIGPGETIDFRLAPSVVDGALLRLSFRDFVDRRRGDAYLVSDASGTIRLKPASFLRRLRR